MFLEVKKLTKYQNGRLLFKEISFGAEKGEAVSIVSKNPLALLTLMQILSGKQSYDGGSVRIGGNEVRSFKRSVFLPRNCKLLPNRTVSENLLIPLQLKGFKRNDALKIVSEHLKIFDIERFSNYYPCQLSNSILKIVAIAEMGLFDADIILLDEPFYGIDNESRNKLYRYINSKRLEGITIILATENDDEAEYLTEKTVFIDEFCGITTIQNT